MKGLERTKAGRNWMGVNHWQNRGAVGKIGDYKDFCLKALSRTWSIKGPELKHKVASLTGLTSQRMEFRKEIQERKPQRLLKSACKIWSNPWLTPDLCMCRGYSKGLSRKQPEKQNKTKQMEAEKYWEILAVSHLRAHRIWNFIPVKLTVCLKRNALLFKRKIKEFRFFYNIPSTMLSIKGIFLKPTKLANKQENVTYSQKKESQ